MNTFKIVTFDTWYDEFMGNMNEKCGVHPSICEIFKGYTQDTFSSIIQKLTNKNTSPLALYYDSPHSLSALSKKKLALDRIFKFLDFNHMERIDAYEFYTPILLLVDGKMEKFWDYIIENFGVDQRDKISCDELFYFIDSMFRGLSKILILKGDNTDEPVGRCYRLNHGDINNIISRLFGQEGFLTKETLRNNCNNDQKFNWLLTYIHETGSGSLKMENKENRG
jgi:hypothetical protein